MKLKYTKEMLEEAVKNSNSTSDVVRYLNMRLTGGSHRHVKQRLLHYNINISHFTSDRSFAGQKRTNNYSKTGYLILLVKNENNIRTEAKYLRLAIKEYGIEEKCAECGLGCEWNNKPIKLQIDHINGDGSDNRIDNLRYLCPNCHTQTDTYGSKNPNRIYLNPQARQLKILEREIKKYCNCGKEIYKDSKTCMQCYGKNSRKVKRPSKEVLEKLVWEKPTAHIALEYNMSDKAVEKWCKNYGIVKPPRGYWQKQKCLLSDMVSRASTKGEKDL